MIVILYGISSRLSNFFSIKVIERPASPIKIKVLVFFNKEAPLTIMFALDNVQLNVHDGDEALFRIGKNIRILSSLGYLNLASLIVTEEKLT